MSGFHIREARGNDREAITRLWRSLMEYHQARDPRFTLSPDSERRYFQHTHAMIRSREAKVLVAVENTTGRVIGYLMGEIQRRPPKAMPGVYGFISDMFVQEEWRRHGVGAALFETMRLWFREKRAQAIELYIAEANPGAAAFWEAMGLQPFLRLLHLDL